MTLHRVQAVVREVAPVHVLEVVQEVQATVAHHLEADVQGVLHPVQALVTVNVRVHVLQVVLEVVFLVVQAIALLVQVDVKMLSQVHIKAIIK